MDSSYIREGDKVIKRPIKNTHICLKENKSILSYNIDLNSSYTVDLEDILHMCQTFKDLGFSVLKDIDEESIDILIQPKEN